MSSFTELLLELCPNGVGQLRIGDFALCHSGATPDSKNSHYWSEGTIPWMSSGEVSKGLVYATDNYITQLGFDSCSTKIVPAGSVVMALAGQGKTRGTVARTRIELCTNQSLCSIIPFDSVNADYLYFFLSSKYLELRNLSSGEGGRGGLNLQIIRDVLVPVPPMKVQLEIVKILDAFKMLEAELEAELEARKKQAFVYRQSILNFDAHKEAVWAQLGSVCRTYSGDFVKKTKQDDNFQFPVFNGGSSFTGFYSESNSPANSITISARGSIGSVNWVDVPFWAGNSCHVISPDSAKLVSRYLYHYLKHNETALQKLKAVGTIPALNLKPLLGFEIPIPSLEAQAQIVKKLDMFDALINDLSFGIPAELAARRKQYEYYREQLLTFKEA